MRSTEKAIAVDATGCFTLTDVNGYPLICAYRNPFLNIEEQKVKSINDATGAAKKTSMEPNYCNSQCPHFHCFGNQKKVTITCSGIAVEHPVLKVFTEEKTE